MYVRVYVCMYVRVCRDEDEAKFDQHFHLYYAKLLLF